MNNQKGVHHISVIAGDPQRNAAFYVKTLGMRMVKKSVNQDDPGRYHLFYGNATGDPGSGLTFFPWPEARRGKSGVGEAAKVALAVPSGSKSFWMDHLEEAGINFDGPYDRFGQQAIGFSDPDGLYLELVFDERVDAMSGWEKSTLPTEYGVRGFKGTTLRLNDRKATAEVLTQVFEFEETDQSDNAWLYTTDAEIGNSVIVEEDEPKTGANGTGIVHHVAFRAADVDELTELRQKVIDLGLHPTDVIDRHWFHSVYFRSPGGVLFEIATDGPGYDVDEDPDKLGQKLILPPWLEAKRKGIEKRLPEINI